jgi:hypothetical protein
MAMQTGLRINLLHLPQIRGVLRAEELVPCTFPPTVERPLMRSHKVFTSQCNVLIIPND